MTVRTILIAAILIVALAAHANAAQSETVACTITQTVTNPDGTKTSGVRFAEHCVLLPVVFGADR